jgi:hypothetical protein
MSSIIEAPDFRVLLSSCATEIDYDELTEGGGGFSSAAYFTPSHVVKLGKSGFDLEVAAQRHVDKLNTEQERICNFLGDRYIVMAEFVVGRISRKDYRVCAVQERVYGVSMESAVRRDPACAEEMAWYLGAGLRMYSAQGEIPDLACLENRFNPLVDPNTQVVQDETVVYPVLVDTTYGRSQRRPYIGIPFRTGIAWGVGRALRKLEQGVVGDPLIV